MSERMKDDSSVVIKRVTPENYHLYEDMIYWRINGNERSDEEKIESSRFDYADRVNELDTPGFYAYGAEMGSRFVGWIHLIYMPKLGKWKSGMIYVDELWVTPELRRRGVASLLMKEAENLKEELGACKIRLYTSNPAAQKLYEKSGMNASDYCVFMEAE